MLVTTNCDSNLPHKFWYLTASANFVPLWQRLMVQPMQWLDFLFRVNKRTEHSYGFKTNATLLSEMAGFIVEWLTCPSEVGTFVILLIKYGASCRTWQLTSNSTAHIYGNSGRHAILYATFAVAKYEKRYKQLKIQGWIFKVSNLLGCLQNICRSKSFRDIGRRRKVVFGASLPDVLVKTPLFVRGRYRCVGRYATV